MIKYLTLFEDAQFMTLIFKQSMKLKISLCKLIKKIIEAEQ